ncbi:PH domain-containing protein [Alteromonas sp. ASW11-130]|uniref:PH domain-containing protein n=1 Tax=Alteromonas sp. ASW11-130 TaxID=3015775 RepID=UPI002241C735|nr:PH domain-containing protein [Alteromonas sp. ASW11-130]MCW8092685.1 PH domain-containing protein [Alteromonas sp. ASW11-130]
MKIDDFSNEPVVLSQLPDAREVETHPLSPRYRIVNLATVVVVFLLISIGISIVYFQPWFPLPEPVRAVYPIALGIVGFISGCSFVYHWLADPRIRYAVRQQDLILHKGLIFRKVTCQPILRVQHIELKRGPLDRFAGLAKIQVFSAGGSAHTFEIPGLPIERAAQLRQFILDHKELDAR